MTMATATAASTLPDMAPAAASSPAPQAASTTATENPAILRQRKAPPPKAESDAYRADDESGDVDDDKKSLPAEDVTWGKTPNGDGECSHDHPQACLPCSPSSTVLVHHHHSLTTHCSLPRPRDPLVCPHTQQHVLSLELHALDHHLARGSAARLPPAP